MIALGIAISFTVLAVLSITAFVPIIMNENRKNERNFRKPSLLDYFGIKDGIQLSWAHAVNNKKYLFKVLSDPRIMMLEADVILDPVNNIPIMAHPPETSSDITLQAWLNAVTQTYSKGMKLDFKQTSAVLKSQDDITAVIKSRDAQNVHQPIILNADILRGPNSYSFIEPVDSEVFIKTCMKFSNVIVSPGWTTGWNMDKSVGYSWDNVKDMYKIVKELEHYVTFPVRASLVRLSSEQLTWLLQQDVDRFSLTIWTTQDDVYDVKELLFLRKFKGTVYFDLPISQISEIISLSG